MGTILERLALIIDADGKGAVRELDKVGKAADRELGRAEKKSRDWGRTFTSIGTKMVAASAVVGVGLWNAAQATSDLNEAVNQTEQVFGSASDKVGEFAKGAVSIGQSERSAREAANTFGLFFEKANLSTDAVADMSIEMTKLASDMASFKNTSPEEAIDAIGAALRGESEPIRRYGVLLDDATLKQRAFDMGLVDSTTGVLPPAIKMQAAYAEILEQTGTIQGDFVRTADGAANAQRIATAEFENAKAEIGEGFLPVMQQIIGIGGSVASTLGNVNEATGGFVSKMLAAGTVIAGVGGGAALAVGQFIKMKEALDKLAASSKVFATMNAALGPLAVSAAGLVALWGANEYWMKQASDAATDMGIEIEGAILKADPEKLNRMIAETNRQILGVKDELANSSDWAVWDTDFREQLNAMGVELEKQGTLAVTLQGQMIDLANATGNSQENTLGWLQAQAEAGILYEDSAGAIEAYRKAVEAAELSTSNATAEEIKLAEKFADSREAVEDLTKAIDDYFSTLDAAMDLDVAWEQAQDNLTDSLSNNGLAWDYVNGKLAINTEEGRNNWQALKDVRDAAIDYGQAIGDSTQDQDAATAATQAHIDALKEQLRAAGYSEEAIQGLIETLHATPEDISTSFHQPDLSAAITNVGIYQNELDQIPLVKETQLKVRTIYDKIFAPVFGGARASGGSVDAGKSYLVGEQGPEVITMGGDGYVHPNRDTRGMGGTQTIQLVVDSKVLAEVIAPRLASDRRAHTGSRRVGT